MLIGQVKIGIDWLRTRFGWPVPVTLCKTLKLQGICDNAVGWRSMPGRIITCSNCSLVCTPWLLFPSLCTTDGVNGPAIPQGFKKFTIVV